MQLAVPQRQQKAELIELVERNAAYELQRAQRGAEQQHLATEDLAQLLDLAVPPRRIEGFDISHIQGSDAVASQVVFVDGLPAKQHYRRYRIQSSSILIFDFVGGPLRFLAVSATLCAKKHSCRFSVFSCMP
jgi:excinuclease ABC subunit C